jgi:hypothetical protein
MIEPRRGDHSAGAYTDDERAIFMRHHTLDS